MPKELFSQPLITTPSKPDASQRLAFGSPGVAGGINIRWDYFEQIVKGYLTANVLANLGVGLFVDRPDISTTNPGDIYVTSDTFRIYTAIDITTWYDQPLLNSQMVTDTSLDPAIIYQYDGVELLKLVDQSQQFEGAIVYYLDHNAGDIATYEELLRVPVTIVEQIETININANTVLFDAYATPIGQPGATSIPAGLWIMHAHVQFSSVTGQNIVHWDMYKRASGGAETFLFTMSSPDVTTTDLIEHQVEAVQAAITLLGTDRLVLKVSAQTTGGAKTATLHYSGIDNFAFVQTPLLASSVVSHNNTTGKELAGAGVTWGHVNDQTQTIAGAKTFSGDLALSTRLMLPNTTATGLGVIYKAGNFFLHNYKHPTGLTAVPDGKNIFFGENAGNFTMGQTANNAFEASYNSVVGGSAFVNNTKGYENSVHGFSAMQGNTLGYQNAAFGNLSLYTNSTGYQNSCFGFMAGFYNITGYQNIFIGRNSGNYLANGITHHENGNNSIFIGDSCRANADSETNQIIIGSGAIGNGSNTVTVGNTSIIKTVLRGNVGVGTVSPTSGLQVAGLPTYASNAAALSGGLTVGAFYLNSTYPDLVAIVHA